VSLLVNKPYCVNSTIIWKAQLSKGDSVSSVGISGPFSGDTLIKTTAKLGNPKERFWIKGSNGCVSIPLSVSYTVVDSSFAPQLAGIDSQLTQVVFRWKAQPLAIQYSCSKDSGKTWTNSGNNGLDTQFAVATRSDKSPVSLWVRYSINNDCMISPIARFNATTKSCTPINYSAEWTTTPLCVGSKARIQLKGLPTKYHTWMNGVAQGQTGSFEVDIKSTSGKIDFAVLDSAQTVCGTTQKSLSWIAESISANQLKHNLDTLSPNITCGISVWFANDCDTNAVKSAWVIQNGKKVSAITNVLSGITKVVVKNGDTLWLQGVTAKGCVANSAKARIQVNPLPTANFTISNQGPQYTFTPVDSTGDHLWYIQSAPGWISTTAKPTTNLTSFSNQTVRIFHDITQKGDSCFSQHYQDITLGELSAQNLLLTPCKTFPNPVKTGQRLRIHSESRWSHCDITDASGRLVTRMMRSNLIDDGFTFEGVAGLYYLRCFEGDVMVSQTSLLCSE